MSAPAPTRCDICGTVAAETVCHLCKQPRAEFVAVNVYAEQQIRAAKERAQWERDARTGARDPAINYSRGRG